jgi:hypothetical protein
MEKDVIKQIKTHAPSRIGHTTWRDTAEVVLWLADTQNRRMGPAWQARHSVPGLASCELGSFRSTRSRHGVRCLIQACAARKIFEIENQLGTLPGGSVSFGRPGPPAPFSRSPARTTHLSVLPGPLQKRSLLRAHSPPQRPNVVPLVFPRHEQVSRKLHIAAKRTGRAKSQR